MKTIILTNTMTGKKEPLSLLHPPLVKMYVCGVTPYDYAHIGHGRVYVTFDVLHRLLLFLGYDVSYCRNYTDVDDKLLARAIKERGDERAFKEIADFYIEAYKKDMQALQCLDPHFQPCVTQTIDGIIKFIQDLIERGKAYVVDGDVYFHIASFAPYGKLSKRKLDEMIAGARVALDEKKTKSTRLCPLEKI